MALLGQILGLVSESFGEFEGIWMVEWFFSGGENGNEAYMQMKSVVMQISAAQ